MWLALIDRPANTAGMSRILPPGRNLRDGYSRSATKIDHEAFGVRRSTIPLANMSWLSPSVTQMSASVSASLSWPIGVMMAAWVLIPIDRIAAPHRDHNLDARRGRCGKQKQ